jgi:hypothetical protein
VDNCRNQIRNLSLLVNDGLTAYITIHDKIFNEAATLKSVLKNILGRGVPMSQLLQEAESLIPIWNSITENIESFHRDIYPLISNPEKSYFDILKRYVVAVNETISLLIERQRLLYERSKGGWNNPVKWNAYQVAERKYQSSIQNYMAIGQDLNNASHMIN